MIFRRVLLMLTPALLLAACGQPSPSVTPNSANRSEDVPWSYTAPEGGTTDPGLGALSLDPGNNTLGFEPLLSATNGYGPFETNTSNGEAAKGDGKPMTLNGVVYQKGFGVHSNGTLVYSLQNTQGAVCSIFQAKIGVDDEVGNNGSVVFQVLTGATPVTATVVYDSGVMTGASATKSINLNISGSKVLLLRVTDAGDGNYFDHADWARPIIACADAARPAAGSRDTGFDSSGFGVDFFNGPLVPSFTALQPDGKIIGFGKKTGDIFFFLKRLDQDGHLDGSFALPGLPNAGSPLGLTIYPDGRILMLGFGSTVLREIFPPTGRSYFLARVLPNGNRDTSFGGSDSVPFIPLNIPIPLTGDGIRGLNSLALQPDGKILVGGNMIVRRLLSNGQEDSSFGTAGRLNVPTKVFSSPIPQNNVSFNVIKSVSVQPDGRILVLGGTTKNDFGGSYSVVKRFLPSGAVDQTFGDAGTATVTNGRLASNYAWVAKTRPNGSILIASENGSSAGINCILTQLTSSGQTDTGYTATSENVGYPSGPLSLGIQADGKAVLGGCKAGSVGLGGETALLRFNTDGTLDRSFGKVLTSSRFGAPVTDSTSVLIQPVSVGGKIISGLNPISRVWP